MAPVEEKIRCIHGMGQQWQWCGICNPKPWVKPPREESDPELALALRNYGAAANRRKREGDVWEEGDHQILAESTSDLNGLSKRSKKFRSRIYETAVLLNRSYGSTLWHYNYMFGYRVDAGKPNYVRPERKFFQQMQEYEKTFTEEQRKEMFKNLEKDPENGEA